MSSTKSQTTALSQSAASLSFQHDFPNSSAAVSSLSTTTTTTTTTKKKFGKNLNKHVKQPTPQITACTGASRSSSASTRSGLLLLSTAKKSSSGGLLGSKASSLSSSARGISSSLSVGIGGTNSVNDALLDAAAAEAAGVGGRKGTTQLAWGLKERAENDARAAEDSFGGSEHRMTQMQQEKQPHQPPQLHTGTEVYSNGSTNGREDNVDSTLDNNLDGAMEGMTLNNSKSTRSPPDANATKFTTESSITRNHCDTSPTNGNQYEGHYVPDTTTTTAKTEEDQVLFMAKLARERAEKRRQEEEARVQEQNERAAQRLRELENKMKVSTVQNNTVLNSSSRPVEASSHRWRQHHASGGPTGEVVLERLGSTKGNGQMKKSSGAVHSSESKRNHRTLFDPHRTYSSLVGGIKTNGDVEYENTIAHSRSSYEEKKENSGAGHPIMHDTEVNESSYRSAQQQQHHDSTNPGANPASVIQLSSYEDRGRGGRNANSGPRMLFDPKSGSMVAAPSSRSREESGGVNAGGTFGKGGRKDKVKTKVRNNGKDRDDNITSSSHMSSKKSRTRNLSEDSGNHDEFSDSKYTKHRGGRRDEMMTPRKEKKRLDKERKFAENGRNSSYDNAHKNMFRYNGSKKEVSPNRRYQQRMRIPRTRGVLYMRDDKGVLKSADGCEGDRGYGAHSVPGGRVRNEKAFNIFLQEQQRNAQLSLDPESSPYFRVQQSHKLYSTGGGPNTPKSDYENNGRYSLTRSDFMKMNSPQRKSEKLNVLDNEVPSPLRVKPNEKIELLTGVEESPTLQATAAAWAPSEAALAAAAASNGNSTDSSRVEVNSHESDTDGFSDAEVHARNAMALIDHELEPEGNESASALKLGLGFDPTENMDAVISTPATGHQDKTDEVIMPDLSLDGSHSADERALSNPFGGLGPSLGCSTWGTGSSNVPMGSIANWDLLGSGKKPNVDEGVSADQTDRSTPASFLSLGHLGGDQNNTWGSGGLVSGFTTLAGTPLANTEHKVSADKD